MLDEHDVFANPNFAFDSSAVDGISCCLEIAIVRSQGEVVVECDLDEGCAGRQGVNGRE